MYRDGRSEQEKPKGTSDWLRYLLGPPDQALLARQGTMFRNMWSTAAFLHAAGLTVSRQGEIVPLAEVSDPVYTFDSVHVRCSEEGITEWSEDRAASDRFLFHVRDRERYQPAMTAALASLLEKLP
jgi:hypothetical protein